MSRWTSSRPVNGSSPYQQQQNLAPANCFAQAQAFAFGQTEQQVRADLASEGLTESEIARLTPHKIHPGNQPNSIVLFPRLGPKTLGRLIALYEHAVFTQSVIWGINAFDQWESSWERSSRSPSCRRWTTPQETPIPR